MRVHSGYGILISRVLISGILIAGCSDQAPADAIPTTTPANEVKYGAGDIIAKTESPA
jgi:hypothetical protein